MTKQVYRKTSAGTWVSGNGDQVVRKTSAGTWVGNNGAAQVYRRTAASTWVSVVATTVPGVPTSVSYAASGTTATITFSAPASDGGSAITGYVYGRDGTDSNGAGPWQGTTASPGSYTLTGLVPGTTYNLYVYAQNENGDGTTATGPVTIASGTLPGTITPIAGYDWKSYLSSRSLFENDFFPCFSYSLSGYVDPGSKNSWAAGTSNSFYPFTFATDASVPGGEYIRLFCDNISLHPSDAGKVGGKSWIGSEAYTRRGWTGGYLEFCARFPAAGSGTGMFPALWMYAVDGDFSGTDNTGSYSVTSPNAWADEIDIFEILGASTITWSSSLHADAGNDNVTNINSFYTATTDNDWHTYGCYWVPGSSTLQIYFDRQQVALSSSTRSALAAQMSKYNGISMAARLDYTVWNNTGSSTPESLYLDCAYVRHYASLPF